MTDFINSAAEEFLKRHRRRKAAMAVIIPAGLIIAFLIVFMMMRPGAALEAELTCGLEEHTHSEECYERVLVCGFDDEAPEEAPGEEAHVHDESCYITESVLSCELEENEEHEHGEGCFMEVTSLVCGLEEEEPGEPAEIHVHSEECYDNVLVCGLEEHVHTAECREGGAIIGGDETQEGAGDLSVFLADMLIVNGSGEVTFEYPNEFNEDPVFFYLEKYFLRLGFSLPAVEEGAPAYQPDGNGAFIYALPAGLSVTGGGVGELFDSLTGEPIGSYRILQGETPYIEALFYNAEALGAFGVEFGVSFSADFTLDYSREGLAVGDEENAGASGLDGGGFMGIRAAGLSDTWDLQNFVTGVSVKDKNGNIISNGIFNYDETYTFVISFAERTGAGGQFSYNAFGKMVYQLPSDLKIITPVNNADIKAANGSVIGHYNIDLAGRVEVWFDNVDNQGNPTPNDENFIDYYTNAGLKLSIDAEFNRGGSPRKIVFGAGAEITVTLQEPPAGIKVNKSASSFNQQTESIDYNITITAVGGKVSNISLNDALSFNIQSNFKIKNGDIPGNYALPFLSVQYSVKGGAWTNASFSASGNDWKIDFSGVTLNAGETIQVKYSLNLAGVLDYFASQGGSSRWIQRLNYDLSLDNTATATGKDTNGKDVSAKATTQTPLKKDKAMTKTGKYLSGPNQIEWTAAVGDGSKKLNGLTLTDALQNSQTVTGSVTVRVWGPPNSQGQFSGPGTIVTSPTVSITSGGFTFVVPSGGVTGVPDIYRVEFVYNSTRSGGFPAGNYTNDISVGINGNTSTKRGTTNIGVIGANITTTKTSEWVWNNDGTDVTAIKYTCTVVVPPGYEDVNFFLVDELYMVADDQTGSWPPSLEVPSKAKDFTVSLYPEPTGAVGDPSPFRWGLLSWSVTSNPTVTESSVNRDFTTNNDLAWFLAFPKTQGASGYPSVNGSTGGIPDSIWHYAEQKTITISYIITLDAKTNWDKSQGYPAQFSKYSGTPVKEMLELPGWAIDNEFSPRQKTGSQWSNGKSSFVSDYKPIHKLGHEANAVSPSVFDYTVDLNWSPQRNLNKWPLFASGQAALFEDTFSDKLEYVPGSFYVELYTWSSNTYPANPNSRWYPYSGTGNFNTGTISGTYIEVYDGGIRVDLRDLRQLTWNSAGPKESNMTSTVISASTLTSANSYFRIHYQLKVKNEYGYPDEKLELENTAKVYATSPKFEGGWTSSASVDYELEPVTKEMEVNGSIAETEIIINPLGLRLRPITVVDPYFTAVDTMSDTLAFYLDSIKIYTQDSAGNWKTTPETPQPNGLWSITPVPGDPQSINIGLIDETPIKIVYNALITAPPGTQTTISNTIEVYGEARVCEKSNFIVEETDAEAWGDRVKLRIYKEDEDTRKPIPYSGVAGENPEFEIYLALPDNSVYDGAQTKFITHGTANFYYICDAVYDAVSGAYVFDNPWIRVDGNYMDTGNGVYLIYEKTPPLNYESGNDSLVIIAPISAGARAAWKTKLLGEAPEAVADNFQLTNKSKLGEIVIEGAKHVTVPVPYNGGGATFTFELTQVDDFGEPYIGEDSVLAEPLCANVVIGPAPVPTTYFSFDKITGLEDGVYYFRIEETTTPVGWTLKTVPQTVKVTVEDGEATAEYPGGLAKPVFENKYTGAAAAASIPVVKQITGDEYDEGKEFDFHIADVDVDGNPKPPPNYINSENYTVTITGAGEGLFVIEDLPAPPLGGTPLTYYFMIWEDLAGKTGGWTYDENVYFVTVEVTYDKDKAGVADVTVIKVWDGDSLSAFEDGDITFVNEYSDEQTVDAEIPVKKLISGEDYDERIFTFKIEQVDESHNPITPSVYVKSGNDTVKITGEGTNLFFIEGLPAPGTYYFRIWEDQAGEDGGWTYDKNEFFVKVEAVEDPVEGWIAVVTVDDGETTPTPTPIVPLGGGGLIWEAPGTYGNPFGSANYFSVLTFGNFSVQGADVESGLAVGGNMSCSTGYSLGIPGTSMDVGYPVAPHDPRLLVKGNIALPSLEVWGGTIVVSNSTVIGSPTPSYLRSMPYIGTDEFYDWHVKSNPSLYFETLEYPESVTRESDPSVAGFFSDAEADLKALSQSYRDLSGARIKTIDITSAAFTHPAYINEVNFIDIIYFDNSANGVFPSDYANYDTIVFNLTLNTLSGSQAEIRSSKFTIPGDYDGNIIINVLPGAGVSKVLVNSSAEYINGAISTWSLAREYSDRIIWNFPDSGLTELEVYGHSIIGSVLAPYADFKPNGGEVNGTLVAKSVTAQGGWETHSTTKFGRNKPEEPGEPGEPGGGSVTFVNTYVEQTAEAEIKGTKTIAGVDNTAEVFTFKLEFYDGDAYSLLDETTVTGAGEFSFNLTDLTPGTYYYRLTETAGSAADWIYSKKEVIVEITVDGDYVATVKYKTVKDDEGAEVSDTFGPSVPGFLNRFGGAIMPETGGTGRAVFYAAGVSAVILAAGAFVYRRRRTRAANRVSG